jgi:hypothetical protein
MGAAVALVSLMFLIALVAAAVMSAAVFAQLV